MRACQNRLFLASVCALIASATALANRGVTPEDYFAFHFLSDAHISPDGKQVAYVTTAVDPQRNRRNSSIWIVATDGRSAARRLTAENFNSTSPRWSPDGFVLAFLSNRTSDPAPPSAPAANPANPATPAARVETGGARPQIYTLAMSGGEAQVVSHLKNGVTSFQWSPDGTRFVALSRTGPSDDIAARRAQKRRPPLQAHLLQVQRHGLVRRQAQPPLDHRRRNRQRSAAHQRRRLERHRIRNGRPTAPASRSFPTAPARNTTTATIATSG